MTESELLNELSKLYSDYGPDDAFTTSELSQKLGLGLEATRVRLRAAQAVGRLQVVDVIRTALNGRQTRTKAYRLT